MTTRWKVEIEKGDRHPHRLYNIVTEPVGSPVAMNMEEATAAQIVREHNAHEAMREALEGLEKYLDSPEGMAENGWRLIDARQHTRAALRLAKGDK